MQNFSAIFVIFVTLFFDTVHGKKWDLVYRREGDIFLEMCNDASSGAHRSMSIWRPVTIQNGFYALGDVATANHNPPLTSAIMVKDLSGDALRSPTGFTEVWTDKGSGGSDNIRLMSMNCPEGYVSLGHVGIQGYSNQPDKNKYRCVKEKFVTKGVYELVWNDAGSGAIRDGSIWSNRASTEVTYGKDANTFTSYASHSIPSGYPYLLDGRSTINIIDILVDDIKFNLTVFEVQDVLEMWNDKGSGGIHSVSIWRSHSASNTYSLGDTAVGSYNKPTVGFVVKAHSHNDLRAPSDFVEMWNDEGSGARLNVDIWKPLCPTGFRALGHVVSQKYSVKPSKSSIRCVNETYTVKGFWQYVWNDAGSGSHGDITLLTSLANPDGQGVRAMSAFKGHVSENDITSSAFVLDKSATYYVQGRPAVAYILSGVTYHFNDYLILDSQPDIIQRTNVVNKGNTSQVISRIAKYSYSESYTWSNAAGGEFGVGLKVTAGIPFISAGEIGVSATGIYEHDWGEITERTFDDSINLQLETAACSTKSGVVTALRYKMDIPYTGTLVTVYEDDSQSVQDSYEGVFRGVEVSDAFVVIEPDIEIPGCPH